MQKHESLSSFKIILYGQIMVNLPVVLIIGLVLAGIVYLQTGRILAALISVGGGWYIWGVTLNRWKNRTLSHGVSHLRLYKSGKKV